MYDEATDEFIKVKILGKNKPREGNAIMCLVKDKDKEEIIGTVLEEELFTN